METHTRSSLDIQTASSMETTCSNTPSYMAWSIFNCLFCCLPLGIAAIIYSSTVNNANSAGDRTKAESASRTTMRLNLAALVCGIILIIVIILVSMNS
ncbi:interferon-induced transmembrane protein 1-like [Clupea harengus]|uniref:Interferon-induced transmembrane protein 1-like n=1 Tax=Clupea harengus TaxID=7950 RepID=A0A6P3W2A3_CLUHA|nr:interferon-induced transmembrane protein 1-like [Clupea harengus]